jgi:hypothetical protein
MARVKRWPKSTANWAFAMAHSRGGMVHSFSVLFKDEIEQLQDSLVGRKMPSGADRTAQFGVQRLDGIGGVRIRRTSAGKA